MVKIAFDNMLKFLMARLQTGLEDLLQYLAARQHLAPADCTSRLQDTSWELTVGLDGRLGQAGQFVNPGSGDSGVEWLPWLEGRPWGGLHQVHTII